MLHIYYFGSYAASFFVTDTLINHYHSWFKLPDVVLRKLIKEKINLR